MTNIWVTLIQNNLYSQQILSQVWYGNVPWQDRSTLYKIFHIFMLVVLAPLSAFLMFVFKIKGTTKIERQLKSDPFNQPDGISVALQNKSVIATKWVFRPSTSALFLSHHNGNFKPCAQKKVWTSDPNLVLNVCFDFFSRLENQIWK